MTRRASLIFPAAWLAALALASASSSEEVHYSSEERLDAIDAALISATKSSIDLASYALTDPIGLEALIRGSTSRRRR